MDREPRECPKCADGATAMPIGVSGVMVCTKCSTFYKPTEFGTLEEMSEIDFSFLEKEAQEIVSKYKDLLQGKLKFDLGFKDIGKAGEALGVAMANSLTNFRNDLCKRQIIPHQAVDNILIRALVAQLSIAIAMTVNRNTDPEGTVKKRVKILTSAFNLAIKGFIERFVPDTTTVMVELDESEGEKNDGSGTG